MSRPPRRRADRSPCEWIGEREAFRRFATHRGGVESAKHIKPLHWYIACRLVVEGGFNPDYITPRPPFRVERRTIQRKARMVLVHDPSAAGSGEQVILGGLKTKNVDVVITNPRVGPVLAVSCKGVTKAFRNLTNRMEETIGECTNLHITYPALVLGYYALLRANRTIEEALEAPAGEAEDEEGGGDDDGDAGAMEEPPPDLAALALAEVEEIADNDIAIVPGGGVSEGINRFHAALREMTGRFGIRDDISRYEAMAMALVKPRGDDAGAVEPIFPEASSPLHIDRFFRTLYQRYEERFVFGAPLLAGKGEHTTRRGAWSPLSPAFSDSGLLGVGPGDAMPLGYGRSLADV